MVTTAAMRMNSDYQTIIARIEQHFTRKPQTTYCLQIVNDKYDQTYNFFINIQPRGKRQHSIPLHTVENYQLEYLEKLVDQITKSYHLTIIYDGFTKMKWPVKQELIQRRRHKDE